MAEPTNAIPDPPSPDRSPAPRDTGGRFEDEAGTTAGAETATLGPETEPETDTDDLRLLWRPDEGADPGRRFGSMSDERLGEILVERGAMTSQQLDSAFRVLRQSPGRDFRSILVEMGVDETPIQQVVAEGKGLTFERIDPDEGFDASLVQKLGPEYCKANQVLPLRTEKRRVAVAVTSPDDVFLLDEIRRKLGGRAVRQVLVVSSDIALALELLEGGEEEEELVDDILADISDDDIEVVEEDDEDLDIEKAAGESPVIRYVNYIIQNAIREGASDIHIEPGERRLKVRFRIDGVLYETMNPPHRMHAAIISRLKIMANLDISERRLPQDGRIRIKAEGNKRKLDLRVSTVPTVTGEKCVIRVLDNRSISIGLEELGFAEDTLTMWQNQIDQPHGIILVTGPTGSGKTTTLYSSLRQMDTQRLNVSTVEDPVEYHLDGINQIQTHEKIGMTFNAALRSLLRQDPDVVMVGEIRDGETARIAVQAALTGHLVLSTLHTNDAPGSVTRLINIGVEPFLIGAALNAVLAQRLVRRICSHCRGEHEPTPLEAEFLAMQGRDGVPVHRGSGCDRCRQTGYQGRQGIYEMLLLDDVTRDAIARNPNVTEFRRMCVERGMVTLQQDGMQKVCDGKTTVEEVLRVTQSGH